MIPKALYILGGLAVSVILKCIFYCFGWEWMAQAIGVPSSYMPWQSSCGRPHPIQSPFYMRLPNVRGLQ